MKKKSTIPKLWPVFLMAALIIAGVKTFAATGSGTISDPFILSNPGDFDTLRNHLGEADVYFELGQNIDFTGVEWLSIGSWTGGDDASVFIGHLDGKNFEIQNLAIDRDGQGGNVGFFSGLRGPAEIKDLSFTGEGAFVLSDNTSGVLAGFVEVGQTVSPGAMATITNCHSSVSIWGNDLVGGLIGSNNGANITGCSVTGKVRGFTKIGGIVGDNSGATTISKCFTTDTILYEWEKGGGIVGTLHGTATVTDCYSTAMITNGTTDKSNAGGIAGEIYETAVITNCYTACEIKTENNAGGIVGIAWDAGYTISNCIANTSIIDANNFNRITGTRNSAGATYTNNYAYDGIAFVNADTPSDVSEGLTTMNGLAQTRTEVKTEATYRAGVLGWDFNTVWEWNALGFPTLQGISGQPVTLPAHLEDVIPVTKIEVDGSLTLVGATSFVTATAYPIYADETGVTFSVDNPSIATIDAVTGELTGVSAGEVVVTVTSNEVGSMVTAQITITIFDPLTGSGTSGDPYKISNADDLLKVGQYLDDESLYFVLTNDIDMTGYNDYTPIGTASNFFMGNFDGAGYAIQNVKITANNNAGLFRTLKGPAVIANLTLSGDSVTGGDNLGALAGSAILGDGDQNVVITNCTSAVHVTGGSNVGGFIGNNTGAQFTDCSVSGNVTGSGQKVGGITGYNAETITNCSVSGNVTGGNNNNGGIAGHSNGIITGCSMSGSVQGLETTGGIVGWCQGDVNTSFMTNKVTGTLKIGGIVGVLNGATVSQCFTTDTVLHTNSNGGGIAGSIEANGIVNNCYSTAFITNGASNSESAGGIAGEIWGDGAEINNCYATGNIKSQRYSAGIVGRNHSNNVVKRCMAINGLISDATGTEEYRVSGMASTGIDSCYAFDGIYFTDGTGPTTTVNGIKTVNGMAIESAKVTAQVTYTDSLNWDFATVWEFASYGLPVLQGLSNQPDTIPYALFTVADEIILSGNNITTLDGTSQISLVVNPDEARDTTVTWSVDYDTVAIVDQNGMLTAVGNGVVTVTATSNDIGAVTGNIAISVTNQTEITGITVAGQDGATTISTLDGTLQMIATLDPLDTDYPDITWSVDDMGIATIDETTGVLTAVANGDVVVTATSDFNSAVNGSATITVSGQVEITGLTVMGTDGVTTITTNLGTLQMLAIPTPANTDYPEVTWSVDNENIATIDASGLLTANVDGDVVVTATATYNNAITANITITITGQVYVPITGVTVVGSNISFYHGTSQMTTTITPADATYKTVTWSVDDESLATIDANGLLTAVSDGDVEVTATSNDPNVSVFGTKTITLTNQVYVPVTEITVSGADITTLGGTSQLSAVIAPANASYDSIYWSVDNEAVATIDIASGLLSAVANGTVVVTATSNTTDNVTGTLTINVSNQNPITGLAVQGTGGASTIETLGGTLTMIATPTPIDADDASVIWSVDDASVATINATTGVLTAVSNGMVEVTATSVANNSISRLITITITGNNPVNSISVSTKSGDTSITELGGTLALIAIITPSDADDTTVYWSVNDTAIAVVDSASGILTAVSNGEVTVTATALANSTISDSISISITGQTTGIVEFANTSTTIYPNPASDYLNIEGIETGTEIKIYSMDGTLVKSTTYANESINVSGLYSGIYIVKVNNNALKLYKE